MTDGNNLSKDRMGSMMEEIDTKGLYIALALLFVADAAGVFAASVPVVIFVALFLIAVGIDAFN
jgi:hypothetical protein